MELKLGTNKVITLTPWKSKTKKDFIKLFKEKEDKVSEEDIINVLVMPYISDTKAYYSPDEIQYILVELRKLSIDEEIAFSLDCDKCGEVIDIDTTLTEITDYTPNKFPIETGNVQWRDLPNKDSLKKVIKKYPAEPPRNLQTLLHMSHFQGQPVTSIDEIMEKVDNLSLKEDNELLENFESVQSIIKISKIIKCNNKDCKFEKDYIFDVIPTFYDPLLPKDM